MNDLSSTCVISILRYFSIVCTSVMLKHLSVKFSNIESASSLVLEIIVQSSTCRIITLVHLVNIYGSLLVASKNSLSSPPKSCSNQINPSYLNAYNQKLQNHFPILVVKYKSCRRFQVYHIYNSRMWVCLNKIYRLGVKIMEFG